MRGLDMIAILQVNTDTMVKHMHLQRRRIGQDPERVSMITRAERLSSTGLGAMNIRDPNIPTLPERGCRECNPERGSVIALSEGIGQDNNPGRVHCMLSARPASKTTILRGVC
jgi:hypothetical protein